MISGLRAFLSIGTDRRVGEDAIALVHRDQIDIVVADVIVSGGIQRLVAAGIPTACLAHSFFAFAEGMSRSPVGLLMRLRGLDLLRVEGSTLGVLVTARRDLDPARSAPPYAHFTGVVWQGAPVPATPSNPPTVLVSLSTVAFPGQQRTLQSILDALAGLPVQAVVTTGPAIDPSTLLAGANTRMHAWLDHAGVLPTASLVIGHGGHSTTMRALSYGIPVLVIPSNPMLDQRMVGTAVAGAGVGATLPRGTASERIAAEVTRLLSDQSVQHAATAVGEDIRQQDGATVAANLIDRGVLVAVASGMPMVSRGRRFSAPGDGPTRRPTVDRAAGVRAAALPGGYGAGGAQVGVGGQGGDDVAEAVVADPGWLRQRTPTRSSRRQRSRRCSASTPRRSRGGPGQAS